MYFWIAQQGLEDLLSEDGMVVAHLNMDHDTTTDKAMSLWAMDQPAYRLFGEHRLFSSSCSDAWHRNKNTRSAMMAQNKKGETVMDQTKDTHRIARTVSAAIHQAKAFVKRPQAVEKQMVNKGAPPLDQRMVDNFILRVDQIIPHFFNVERDTGHPSCEAAGNVACSLVQARLNNCLLELVKTVRPLHFHNGARTKRDDCNVVVRGVAQFLGLHGYDCEGEDYLGLLQTVDYNTVQSTVLFQGKWAGANAKNPQNVPQQMKAMQSIFSAFTQPHVARSMLLNNFGTNRNESNHSVQFAGCNKTGREDGWKWVMKMQVGIWRYVQLMSCSSVCLNAFFSVHLYTLATLLSYSCFVFFYKLWYRIYLILFHIMVWLLSYAFCILLYTVVPHKSYTYFVFAHRAENGMPYLAELSDRLGVRVAPPLVQFMARAVAKREKNRNLKMTRTGML